MATPDADRRPRGDAASRVLVAPGERPRIVVRAARPAASGTLTIGALRIPLRGSGGELWTLRAGDDHRALAAMRAAPSMSLVARGAGGGTIRHRFALAGAATAIDAAILGCGSQNRRIDPR